MSSSENELKYKQEILNLINEFIEISKKSDTNLLEDNMLRSLGLNGVNFTDEAIECFQYIFLNEVLTADDIIEILKK
jgi:hypothetical protein